MLHEFTDKNSLEYEFIQLAKRLDENLQHKIFKKVFLQYYIYDIKCHYRKEDIPSISSLVVNKCNYPGNLTVRGYLNRNSMKNNRLMPCKKAVKKNHFFCSTVQHALFASKCNLPLSLDQVDDLKVSLNFDKKEKETNILEEPKETTENIQNCNDLCIFECPVTGKQCLEMGEFVDFYNTSFYHCKNHTTISQEMLDNVFNYPDIYNDYIEIQKLDVEIKDFPENPLDQHFEIIEKRCRIAHLYGIGFDKNWECS